MQSERIAQGLPVYLAPNANFNPHVYMPLYFWLGAVLLKTFGTGFTPLRLLSLGSTVATMVLIYWIAYRECRQRWIGFSSGGLFIAGYAVTGFWYELARVDSLFIALTLGGFALAVYSDRSDRKMFLSAIVFALAAFAKQSGFVVAAGLALCLFLLRGRRAWIFLVSFCTLTIIPMLAINWATGGWFFYHIFYIGSADPTDIARLYNFVNIDILTKIAGLSVLLMFTIIWGVSKEKLKFFLNQPWVIGIGLAVLISALGRYRVGGNVNDLMPGYTFLCLAPAIFAKLTFPAAAGPENRPEESFMQERSWALAAFILIQFYIGRYSPESHVPDLATRLSGDHLIQQIASVPGPVLVMMHPYYSILAGKEPSTQIATLWYVRHRGELPIPDDFIDRIKNHYYSEIISDESFFETQTDLHTLITTYYHQAQTLDPNLSPPTDTGVVVQPRVIYLPSQP